MQPKDAAIRKRTQITKANRTMFAWVAIVSIILGFTIVGSVFLAQKLFFNEKVLAEKNKTISVLTSDNANITELESQVRILDANTALASVKASPNDQTLQVILDALPSDANSLALGASLQNKLLTGINGLTIVSLQVDPVVGVETTDASLAATSATVVTGSQSQITFRFSVSGTQLALQQALQQLEKSIRAIDVTSLKVESQGATELMTVQARAFYEPARVVQLKDKVIKQ
jgi:hypothetical protein